MMEKVKDEIDGSIVMMESKPSTTIFNSKVRLEEIAEGIARHEKQIVELNKTKSEIESLIGV